MTAWFPVRRNARRPERFAWLPGRRRTWLTLFASLGLAVGLYGLLKAAGMPVLPPARALAQTDRSALAAYALVSLFGLALRMVRWHWQLAPIARLPLRRVLAANLLGNAAIMVLPLRMGEFVRPSLIARGGGVSFFSAAATSVAERVIDALMMGAVLLGCLQAAPMLDPLPDHIGELQVSASVVPRLGVVASVLAVVFSLAIGTFYVFRGPISRGLRSWVGRLFPRFAAWLEAKLLDACRGLEFLTTARFGLPFALLSAGYWLSFWGGTWFILRWCGFRSVGLAQAGVVAGALAFGLALPNAPGFFGSFQAAVYASLALFYPTASVVSHGAVAVFWLYVTHFGCLFALVPWALWMARRSTAPGPLS